MLSITVRFAPLALCLALAGNASAAAQSPIALDPAHMPRIATVDERFQSYNVEMVEVTGGRFWAPYKAKATADSGASAASIPAGMDPSLYRYRTPIDLTNPRLRKLAAALGPAYIRVSGTWQNKTFFQDADDPAPTTPPAGFGGVLTRDQWRGVIDFSHATNAKIVTSFAISDGVRDKQGVWTPVEATKFLAFTKASGGSIAAAEMFNEPTMASIGGAPKGYDAAAYGRDFRAFAAFAKTAAPDMLILGPGSVGEGGALGNIPGNTPIASSDMLAAEGPGLDAFSYHFYGGASQRCATLGAVSQTTESAALTKAWLERTDREFRFYDALRNQYLPGRPIWLTETGETACGGNPWASTFLDTFRYLHQLGTLARDGVQVVAHNTLAASDYALINEDTLTPRPNYWAALLWRRLMGTTVLDAGTSTQADLYQYAHCQRGQKGSVALLVINASASATQKIHLPLKSERYTLSAAKLTAADVDLNGAKLALGSGDELPKLAGSATPAGDVSFAPETVTFLTIAGAANAACQR